MGQPPAGAAEERARADSRRRVLAVLRSSPDGRAVQEIAERTGLHSNTVRFHLERLEDEGLASRQVQHRGEPGRPPLAYTATPVPDAGRDHRDFARLAEVLAGLVSRTSEDPATVAIEAGRSWGHSCSEALAPVTDAPAAVAALTRALSEAGFAPDVRAGDDGHTVILQRHCPFLEVAQAHQDVVCSVHLGLVRGVLERMDAPLAAGRFLPFAGPAGCEAHLHGIRSSSS